ncbi:MAG: hypothetical protein HY238_26890, partial [Acidobacteria bacterium]|nr:hypothetical protein [Acidobacteriota bacterium]
LMIKRAHLSVYNAQEADTFGKDSEAGVTLAQRKPVVVYVARLFEHVTGLQKLYRAIDQAARADRDRNEFIDDLGEQGLLASAEMVTLRGPERTKADVMAFVIGKDAPDVVQELSQAEVEMELIRQGYDPELAAGDPAKFAVEKILKLERRALTFRDIHPLALQTSPIDGVARGVMVTRSVEDTARVVSEVLRGALTYEIVDGEANWLLLDRVTSSPVRVVTKDPVLTSAFWSEHWGCPEVSE